MIKTANTEEEAMRGVPTISIAMIEPNPDQPRKRFDDENQK
jgi:hypothetical protein